MSRLSKYRKALVAIAAACAEAVNVGIVPTADRPYVSVVLAVLAAVGVYAAPNTPAG